jgi:hypothetical protein
MQALILSVANFQPLGGIFHTSRGIDFSCSSLDGVLLHQYRYASVMLVPQTPHSGASACRMDVTLLTPPLHIAPRM